MRQTEHGEQSLLIDWWALECRYFGVNEALLYAIPNGGARSKKTGFWLKMEGVRPGVPDLFLAVARHGHNGLFIEMKTECGRLQESQREMLDLLERQGYKCAVCHGFEAARDVIVEYLREESRKK